MGDEQIDGTRLLEEIVDHVMAVLPPYETSVYLYLLRRSHLVDSPSVRVGKRTIGEEVGKGTRSRRGSYQHISEKLNNLARNGFISIGDTTRLGTLYTVALPSDVPAVRERMATEECAAEPANHYRDPGLRTELFERDSWRCQYCGERVRSNTATLDHIVPVSKGGRDDPENLATTCLMCNSIKSGRTYEEAAPQILAALRSRRAAT